MKTYRRLGWAVAITGLGVMLLAGPIISEASFPGGNGTIAFVSDRDGGFEIYTTNGDGSPPVRLTTPGNNASPAYSSDGAKIAFHSDRDDPVNLNPEIYVMNSDGSGQQRITTNPAVDASPAWSPDGSKIAFTSDRDGNAEIYVMNADGTNQVRLTNDPGFDSEPDWSPDGSRIAFESTRNPSGGNRDLFLMDPDGSNVVNVTNSISGEFSPSWSPDGTRIAFSSDRDSNFDIWAMDSDGTNPVNLTGHPADDTSPSWSPDGTRIAFRSGRPVVFGDIFIMDSDGTFQGNITNAPGAIDSDPAWQPLPGPGTGSCANTANETGVENGPVSGAVHSVEPATGPLGPTVHELNCTVVVPIGL
jgi:Tol biopolymer transport system component